MCCKIMIFHLFMSCLFDTAFACIINAKKLTLSGVPDHVKPLKIIPGYLKKLCRIGKRDSVPLSPNRLYGILKISIKR